MPRAGGRVDVGFVVIQAVCVALSTAVGSAVFDAAWRPSPLREESRVVAITERSPGMPVSPSLSYAQYRQWRTSVPQFDGLAAMRRHSLDVQVASRALRARAADVSPDFFSVLGIAPSFGRTFDADTVGAIDDVPVLVSSRFARQGLGRDDISSAIGVRIDAGRATLAVIGILPEWLDVWYFGVDLWLPADSANPLVPRELLTEDGYRAFEIFGRLGSDVTASAASAALARARIAPDDQEPASRIALDSIRQRALGATLPHWLWFFGLAATLLLSVGVFNLAHLTLARVADRRAEVALQRALGADASIIAVRLASRHLRMTAVAAALAAIGAVLLRSGLTSIAPPDLLPLVRTTPDAVVVVLAAAAALIVGACTWVIAVIATLQDRGSLTHVALIAERRRLPSVWVALQVAAALVTMVGAGVVVSSYVRLNTANLGFDADKTMFVRLLVRSPFRGDDLPRAAVRWDALVSRVQQSALLDAAGIGPLPLGGSSSNRSSFATRDGRRFLNGDPSDRSLLPGRRFITPGHLEALGIDLVAGRFVTWDDYLRQQPVVLVNETMAAMHWPGRSAIGETLNFGQRRRDGSYSEPWSQIVGVVEDARFDAINEPQKPEVFSILSESADAGVANLVVRSDLAAPDVVRAVRAALEPEANVAMMASGNGASLIADALAQPRFFLSLAIAMGVAAVLIAWLGVYAITQYQVSRLTRELAVRAALGAATRHLAYQIVRDGARAVLVGVTAGAIGSFWVTDVLRAAVFDAAQAPFGMALIGGIAVTIAVLLMAFVKPVLGIRRLTLAVLLRAA